MAYGLEIIGSHGVVQIDQDYTNLCLVTKGTVSWGANSFGSVTLTLPSTSSPLLAIQSSTPVLVWSDNAVPNTTYTFISSTAGSATYYLFDNVQSTNGETWGLAVYKGDGSLAYHSSWKILRIGALGAIPSGSLPAGLGSVTASVGAPYAATWAAIVTSSRYKSFMISSSVHATVWEALKCDNSGASMVVDGLSSAGIYVNDQPQGGNILLIDVTGY